MANEQIEMDVRQLTIKVDNLAKQIDSLRDKIDQWVRWIIGLQMGTYVLLVLAYFTHR